MELSKEHLEKVRCVFCQVKALTQGRVWTVKKIRVPKGMQVSADGKPVLWLPGIDDLPTECDCEGARKSAIENAKQFRKF